MAISSSAVREEGSWLQTKMKRFIRILQPYITILWHWKAAAVHLTACIILALVILLKVDGYKALDGPGTARRANGKFRFRSGDIITLLSAAIIILTVTASAWSGAVLWKCAYAVLHRVDDDDSYKKLLNDMRKKPPKGELKKPPMGELKKRLREARYILEFKVQRWTLFKIWKPKKRLDYAIAVALFPITLQLISSPLLEGSVDWKSSSEFGRQAFVASSSATANFSRWRWYSAGTTMSDSEVKIAAGLAGVAWENATAPEGTLRSKRCRHVVNDRQFRAGSALHNVTLPCIIIHNVSWPTSPMPETVTEVFKNTSMISISGGNPFSDASNPGIAVLFDHMNTTLKIPPAISERNGTVHPGISEPIYPASFLFSGKMIAIVQLSQKYAFEPRLLDPFGYPNPNNNVSAGYFIDLVDGEVEPSSSYTYLEVEFTAGVSTPETSLYITNKVVESGPIDPVKSDIHPGPWVKEALYMMPDVMATVAIMNNTSLEPWRNIANYTEHLIRASYMGAWDMLHNRFDQKNKNLKATLAEPRLQASVSKKRIAGWLGIQMLFVLTFLPILYVQKGWKEIEDINGPADYIATTVGDDSNASDQGV